jgi:hypothetical protein
MSAEVDLEKRSLDLIEQLHALLFREQLYKASEIREALLRIVRVPWRPGGVVPVAHCAVDATPPRARGAEGDLG